MKQTTNDFEHSVTVERADGSKVDFCAFPTMHDFAIGITRPDGRCQQQIILSPEETSSLLDHLLDGRTQSALS